MSKQSKRILVVCYLPGSIERTRATILHHLRVLEYSEAGHDLVYYNTFDEAPYSLPAEKTPNRDLSGELRGQRFDAVLLHYTFLSVRTVGYPFYSWKPRFAWMADLDCPQIAIPQDEGNYAEVLDEWLDELRVSAVFSVHYKENGPLYPSTCQRAHMLPCLPGYVDTNMAKRCVERARPVAERPHDIVYRARRLAHRFGRAGQRTHDIADRVLEVAPQMGLNADISTRAEDAIPGDQWFAFLASGRCVIGCEGGYSAIDWRGELAQQIIALAEDPAQMSFEQVDAKMPNGWDSQSLLTITPRHFEAMMTKTAQLLVSGHYKGVLEPERHYLPIEPDYSNLGEVLEAARDHDRLQRMVDRAYEEVCLDQSYHYPTFAQRIEEAIEMTRSEHAERQNKPEANGSTTSHSTDQVAALERALTAERHRNMLLEHKLTELCRQTPDQLGRLEQGIAFLDRMRKAAFVGVLALAVYTILGLALLAAVGWFLWTGAG